MTQSSKKINVSQKLLFALAPALIGLGYYLATNLYTPNNPGGSVETFVSLTAFALTLLMGIICYRAMRKTESEFNDQFTTLNAMDRSQARIVFDPKGRILEVNENFLDAMDYTRDELIGQHHSMFVDPEYARSQEYSKFWTKLRNGEFDTGQYTRFAKNGKEIWIQATYNPVFNDDGEVVKVIKYAVDVSDRKDISLRSTRIQASLDYVTSCVMVADEDNNIIYFNDSVASILRNAESEIRSSVPSFNMETLLGTNIDTFHKNPKHQRDILKDLNSSYRTSITMGGRTFALIASPIFSESGQRIGTVVEWNDKINELNIENEIKEVVEAAVAGDFSRSLSLKGKDGFLLMLSERINELTKVVDTGLTEVESALSALEQGDLSKQIEGDYQGKFYDIKNATNNTIQKLRNMVSQIKDSASSVNNAASEISSGSVDLSQRTEQQASTLEETAASMEEITQAVRQNSENAEQANTLSIKAEDYASKGHEVATRAVEAMRRIEESSQKVSDIIGVIDEIAFQTNLLALNAAVEAARAGEAGKGFAVVASEVRSLAGRSSSASKEIKNLILESGDEVRSGSELVDAAGERLQEIVSSVKEVSTLIAQITDASSEQTTGIEEINTAVSQMDETTQQNAALVEENTAAAQSMVEQSCSLEEIIAFFKLDGEEGGQVIDFSSPAPSGHKASSAPAVKKAAVNSKSSSSFDDGWEDF